ncbi:Ncam2p [Dermatophagoides farinae]|uniref:Ncam2p n=1 Tax=Dermatophagoides farinae TaxID=6954 RepID=A0A922L6V3_DERFA|nr:Ncam2p [Dermatophagoides farinae]
MKKNLIMQTNIYSSSSNNNNNRIIMSFYQHLTIIILFSYLVIFNGLIIFVDCQQQQQQQQYSLKIYPNVASLSKPSNQKFVITCKGQGGDSNLFSDLYWFTPQDEEINPIFLERHPEFKTINRDGNLFLSFDNPKPELSGTYKCRGLLQNSESLESQINVNIYEDVTWDHCPETQYLIKGNVGERINCRASANPKPNVIWTKEGRQLDSNPRYLINSSGIIIKDSITDDDGGVFQVSALVTETGSTQEKRITVQIYSRPMVEKISEPRFGIENEQIELSCEASGVPQPLYTWLDNNRRNLSSVGGYAVDRNTGTIVISRLKKHEDEGNFTCIAENSAGKSEKSTNLRVYQRPEIRSFRNESYDQYQRSYLECRVIGIPIPMITIRKNGLTRPFIHGDPGIILEERMDKHEKVLTLTYLNTTRDDDGLYYCRAENDAGFAELVGHLEVKFSPNMSLTPMTNVKTWDNRPVNMTCIADAIPNATIKWYKNGYEIFDNDVYRAQLSGGGISKLYITPTKSIYDEQVFGIYRCEATNSLGKNYINIQLDRATVPGLVNDIKIVDIAPTQIRFRIYNDLFDGGMPIKKLHVEYYEKYDQIDHQTKELPFSKLENDYIIDKLKPFTIYAFRFLAENEVGKGQFGQERQIQTKAETKPDKPEFHNLPFDTINRDEILSPYPHKFTVMWNMPPDNGRPIEYFEIRHYPILRTEFGFTPLHEPIISKISVYHDEMTSKTLTKLKSDSYYRVELRAYNALGYSEPANIIFKTPSSDFPDQDYSMDELNEGRLSFPIGMIAAFIMIFVILILIIMDLVFYCRYKVGVIYFLRTHVCNIKTDDQNKLNNMMVANMDDNPKYQSRNIVSANNRPTVIDTTNGRPIEVDNPAFDSNSSNNYATKSPNGESTSLLTNNNVNNNNNDRERERFDHHHHHLHQQQQTRRDQDSVV